MKSLLAGAVALVFSIVTPAIAEDLTAANQWTGFYVGVHGGYANANRNGCDDIGIDVLGDYSLLPVLPIESCDGVPFEEFTFDYNQAGGLAGLQAGYNWTPSEMFLVGLEVSASAANITGELDENLLGGVGTWTSLATATGKAGVTFDRVLVYGEAGFALAKASFEGDLGCVFDASNTGPVAGGGVSFKVTETASIDLKYQHVWLGAQQSSCNSTATALDPAFVSIPTEIRTQGSMDVVKLGLNFQLGH